MPSPTVYLISGANRGIGFSLVQALSSRPDSLICAGVRDPNQAKELNSLAEQKGNVVVVKLEAPSEVDAAAIAELIEERAGKLDVLIANAGIGDYFAPLLEQTPAYFREMFEVNTLGPLVLFQATHHLLTKSNKPKFLAVSSTLGSSTATQAPFAAYGTSKAALNHLIAHAHHDYPDIVSVALCPGSVSTDTGNRNARFFGLDEAPVKPADAAAAVLRLADTATRDVHGGKLWSAWEGKEIPY
ncbi:hypothetical protein JCM8097_003205 [Rhodosporidiobolus ruineniae]